MRPSTQQLLPTIGELSVTNEETPFVPKFACADVQLTAHSSCVPIGRSATKTLSRRILSRLGTEHRLLLLVPCHQDFRQIGHQLK